MRKRGQLKVLAAGLLIIGSPSVAGVRSIDLREFDHAVIVGEGERDLSLYVSDAGDVNGDGTPDAIVAGGLRDFSGAAYIVFGPIDSKTSAAELGANGFAIRGAKAEDFADEIAAAGDVNADGLDDILVGAAWADNNQRDASGTTYVVFGKATTEDVDLAQFDANAQGGSGYRIDGSGTFSLAGSAVDGLGDVNGDGLADVLVGAPFSNSAYVVFGKQDPLPVDLMAFDLGLQGSGGYRIDHPHPENAIYDVAGVGDTNGDLIPDALVHAIAEDGHSDSWVVFGKATPVSVNVEDLGDGGYVIQGAGWGSVAGSGDVNGDGLADVIIGDHPAGEAWVIFGKTNSDPVFIGGFKRFPEGYRIGWRHYNGPSEAGIDVAGGQDVNGDGLSDVVIGAADTDHNGRKDSGSAFVVFGQTSNRPVWLGDLGSGGVRFDGPREKDHLGIRVAMIGDMDGNGRGEVLIGSWGMPSARGKAHLISKLPG
jgi:hypothetical protein